MSKPVKRLCAVFTIVRNEKFLLPLWLKHYSRYFDSEDIFILDNNTDDGSTDVTEAHVIEVNNPVAFDHDWILNTVENFQKTLLEFYEVVIFCEADELIYSIYGKLNEVIKVFVKDSYCDTITCTGYEIVQDVNREKPYNNENNIFDLRNKWFRNVIYDKSLVSRVPCKWTRGFHDLVGNYYKRHCYGLFLAHIHRIDYNKNVEKQIGRLNWSFKDDGPHQGWQHRLKTKEEVAHFFSLQVPGGYIEDIPLLHKNILSGFDVDFDTVYNYNNTFNRNIIKNEHQ